MTERHHSYFTREFGDDTYAFALLLGGIRELETKRKTGINDLYLRIVSGHWYADDLRDVIRIGLIDGGGVKPVDALRLIERYVDGRPILESWDLAVTILQKAIVRDEEAPTQKKSESETEKINGSQDTIGTKSTATVQ